MKISTEKRYKEYINIKKDIREIRKLIHRNVITYILNAVRYIHNI